MRTWPLLLLLIIISVGAIPSVSEPIRENQKRFVTELYTCGRYFDTIAEARRLQRDSNRVEVEYFIYSNYFLAGQYATVLNSFTPDKNSPDGQFRSVLLISASYLKTGMYYESYTALKSYEYSDLPEKYIFPMFLRRIGPLLISGETYKIEDEITRADILLKGDTRFIELREDLKRFNDEGLKSPSGAALMSALVPGLGQCYSGRTLDGIVSFLAVTATAAAGYRIRSTGQRGFSYPLFFFSGLFYAGNIYGAYNSASAANSITLRERFKTLNSRYGSYNPADYFDTGRLFD